MGDNETIVNVLKILAEGLQDEVWRRVERGREKLQSEPDWHWVDYQQGVIHGMDEAAQRLYDAIEKLEKTGLI